MTPEQWREIKELRADALGMDAPRREAFVEAVCERDPAAAKEMKRLMAEYDSSGGFLDGTRYGPGVNALRNSVPDQKIGAYEILREIGAGGMGTVYLAERTDG